MNGKPGDHPITDIVLHRIARYGEPLDSQIRQLGELMSYHRLCDWFEQHWSRSPQQLEPIVGGKAGRDATCRTRRRLGKHRALNTQRIDD